MKRIEINDEILLGFIDSLTEDKISSVSISNYRSDINHFSLWFARKISLSGVFVENFSDIIPFLKNDVGKIYKGHLAQMKLPVSSTNRRLSSLRRLSRFLLSRGFLAFDFMQEAGNVGKYRKEGSILVSESFLAGFEKHLSQESSSKNTIKNYVSDVRHFLTWLERQA